MSELTLERGLTAFLAEIDAPTAAYFSSCVHCGLCAEACLFYLETGDPQYTPIKKLEPLKWVWEQNFTLAGRIKKALGLSKPVTNEMLATWQELLYDSCSLCGRCSMVCPVGVDIAYLVRKTREGMVASGHAPEGLIEASRRAVQTGSPMGLQFPTLQAQIKRLEKEGSTQIPVDQTGADYLILLSSMEIISFPEYLGAVAKIFKQAGVRWTLSSVCFEATNAGIQIGSSDIARELVNRIVKAAEHLKVQTVIGPECGHAFTALRWEGPNLIGRPYPFKALHIIELLDQLRAEGRLKTTGKESDRLTLHDPCNLARKSGCIEPQRRLMGIVAENFVEMTEHGEFNWCCGAGGGVSSNERADALRMKAFRRKKAQIDEIQPNRVVTLCATCRTQLEEGIEEYKMDIPVIGLTELIAEHVIETDE